MIYRLKRKIEATSILLIIGFAISFTAVLIGISSVNSALIVMKETRQTAISWIVTIDEELLTLIKGGITEYSETSSGYLPIYPSEIFRDAIPIGTILSNKYNENKFEVPLHG